MENILITTCYITVIFAGYSASTSQTFRKMHCGITCEPNLKHTMCAFTEKNSKCKELKITPTEEIEEDLLLWHNSVRSEFFENVRGGVLPPGTKIKKLCWDKELTDMAIRWASQCEPVNDRCRKLPRFEVGQNVGVQVGLETPSNSLQTFAEWTKPMDPDFIRSGKIGPSSDRKTLEMFFQVISIDTYLIGCAEATYSRAGFQHRLLVCNYGPAVKNNMDKVYSAAMAIRIARLMKSRRMEIQEGRRREQHSLNNFPAHQRKSGSFNDLKKDYFLNNERSGEKIKIKNGKIGEESEESFLHDNNGYCDIDCNGKQHVMCPSNEDQPQPIACELEKRIDETFLSSCVINKLNELRNLVAGGLTSLPEASDMRMLKWDEELAKLAQTWASKCSRVPDSCRNVERFPVNQLVMVGVLRKSQYVSHCFDMMNELSRMTYLLNINMVQSFSVPSVDHLQYLTQAIWAKTSHVGCAEVLFHTEPNKGMMRVDQSSDRFSSLVCNFGEGGNQQNQKIYKPGSPCSHCPAGTSCTDSQFPNLCVGDTPYTPRRISSAGRAFDGGLGPDSGLMENYKDYCEISCGDKQHVMCGPEVASTSCHKIQVQNDSLVRKCVVRSLNYIRNNVAAGKYAALPTASDMRMLVWDAELTKLARRWAIQCPENTDECRDVERFPVNQIVISHVSSEFHDRFHCPTMMAEINRLLRTADPNSLQNFTLNETSNDPLRYVTQSIWSKSSRVGCAEVLFFQGWGLGDYQMPEDFDDHTAQHASLICNFGEGGNQMNQEVYQFGVPCSQCPVGTSCPGLQSPEYASYPNLCVEVNNF